MGRLLAASFLAVSALAQDAAPVRPEETLPRSVAPQPVAFSHRRHATSAGLACDFCHTASAKGDAATLPGTEVCGNCHPAILPDSPEIAKIVAAASRGEKIAWISVYRVPDYVFFSHAPHVKAGHACAECHGPVETRDVLQKEVSTSMNACLACHRTRGAPQDCVSCHQLGH